MAAGTNGEGSFERDSCGLVIIVPGEPALRFCRKGTAALCHPSSMSQIRARSLDCTLGYTRQQARLFLHWQPIPGQCMRYVTRTFCYSGFFGTSAEFWLNLQSLYEIRMAEQRSGKSIRTLPTLKQVDQAHA